MRTRESWGLRKVIRSQCRVVFEEKSPGFHLTRRPETDVFVSAFGGIVSRSSCDVSLVRRVPRTHLWLQGVCQRSNMS